MSKNSDRESSIPDDVIDALLAGRDRKELFNKGGLIKELTARLVERALEEEMTAHLG